jgi:hypothetical protein
MWRDAVSTANQGSGSTTSPDVDVARFLDPNPHIHDSCAFIFLTHATPQKPWPQRFMWNSVLKQQQSFWEANSRPAVQDILHLLWTRNFIAMLTKSRQRPYPVPDKFNPHLHVLFLSRSISNISLSSMPKSKSDPFLRTVQVNWRETIFIIVYKMFTWRSAMYGNFLQLIRGSVGLTSSNEIALLTIHPFQNDNTLSLWPLCQNLYSPINHLTCWSISNIKCLREWKLLLNYLPLT